MLGAIASLGRLGSLANVIRLGWTFNVHVSLSFTLLSNMLWGTVIQHSHPSGYNVTLVVMVVLAFTTGYIPRRTRLFTVSKGLWVVNVFFLTSRYRIALGFLWLFLLVILILGWPGLAYSFFVKAKNAGLGYWPGRYLLLTLTSWLAKAGAFSLGGASTEMASLAIFGMVVSGVREAAASGSPEGLGFWGRVWAGAKRMVCTLLGTVWAWVTGLFRGPAAPGTGGLSPSSRSSTLSSSGVRYFHPPSIVGVLDILDEGTKTAFLGWVEANSLSSGVCGPHGTRYVFHKDLLRKIHQNLSGFYVEVGVELFKLMQRKGRAAALSSLVNQGALLAAVPEYSAAWLHALSAAKPPVESADFLGVHLLFGGAFSFLRETGYSGTPGVSPQVWLAGHHAWDTLERSGFGVEVFDSEQLSEICPETPGYPIP